MSKIHTQLDFINHVGKMIGGYCKEKGHTSFKAPTLAITKEEGHDGNTFCLNLTISSGCLVFSVQLNSAADTLSFLDTSSLDKGCSNIETIYLKKLIYIDYSFARELVASNTKHREASNYTDIAEMAFEAYKAKVERDASQNDYLIAKGVAEKMKEELPSTTSHFLTCTKKVLVAGLVNPCGELQMVSKSWKKKDCEKGSFGKYFNPKLPEGDNRFTPCTTKCYYFPLSGDTLDSMLEKGVPILIAEGIASAITAHMVFQMEYIPGLQTIVAFGLLRIKSILRYIEFKSPDHTVYIMADVGGKKSNRLTETILREHTAWKEILPTTQIFAPSDKLEEDATDINDLFVANGLSLNMAQPLTGKTTAELPTTDTTDDKNKIYINGTDYSILFEKSDEIIVVGNTATIYFYKENELLTQRPVQINTSKIFGFKNKTATDTLYILDSMKNKGDYVHSEKMKIAFCEWNLTSKDKLLYKNGMLVLNNWWLPVTTYKRDNLPEAQECFMVLLEALSESQEQRDWLLSWVCHLFQTPDARINRTPVLYSLSRGTGKGTLAYLLGLLLHERYAAVSLDDLIGGDWNSDLLNRTFICVEEAKIQKRHVNKLKDVITSAQKRCKEKYKNSYQMSVNQRFMFHVNDIRALGVEPGERRFQMIYGDTKLEHDFFYKIYTKLAEKKGFLADLYFFLNNPSTIVVPIEDMEKNIDSSIQMAAFDDLEQALFEFIGNKVAHPSWLHEHPLAIHVDTFLGCPNNRYFKKHQVTETLRAVFRFDSIRVYTGYKERRLWVPSEHVSKDVCKRLVEIGEEMSLPLEKYFNLETQQCIPQYAKE